MREIINNLCDREVSNYGELWEKENPTLGCCIPVALLIQDELGGDLLRISLKGTPFWRMRYHWFNRLTDGTLLDGTSQFGDYELDLNNFQIMTREKALSIKNIPEKYELLKKRFKELVSD